METPHVKRSAMRHGVRNNCCGSGLGLGPDIFDGGCRIGVGCDGGECACERGCYPLERHGRSETKAPCMV